VVKRKTPTSVVFKPRAFATIKVIALESRRSIAWTVADLVDMVLAQPHIQEKAWKAAHVILGVEPTNPHARAILGQSEPGVDKQPADGNPHGGYMNADDPRVNPPARIEQPVFTLDALAPIAPLPIRTRGARPAQPGPPTPAAYEPEPGPDASGARGLLGR
jgi:hypothetical protein